MNQELEAASASPKIAIFEASDECPSFFEAEKFAEDFSDDRFMIFSDQKWTETLNEPVKDHDFDLILTKFESGSFNGIESTIANQKTPSREDSDDKISLDSMNSCKQLYSDVSSCFFDCEVGSGDKMPHFLKNNENTETVEVFPNNKSFILSDKGDSFNNTLLEGASHDENLISSKKSTKSTKRIKRWLKDEDRTLISIILGLIKENSLIEEELRGSIETNTDTKNVWMFIQNKLHTSRSLDFLQSRYYKLLSNQKLNSKEAALLADKYDTVSIEKFMVIFPGKTRETLTSLISELRSKERKRRISEEKFGHEIESQKDLKICSLVKQPVITLNTFTDKGLTVHIGDMEELGSTKLLKKLDKKTLKRLSYGLNQIIGDIYHQKAHMSAL
ncbi:unnamed protein product [Moneuplotes crassus]|uniref:Uncharacterized protein n=1 Tax=Euplotes crassus TaxID=5936 RepID=A0AAD1X8G6_EUPCR|nr:unnamed protein product [Moneuplotes crassus]